MNPIVEFLAILDKHGAAVAYIGSDNCSVTGWHGQTLGNARQRSKWRVESFIRTHMRQYSASIGGRDLYGRGFGEGMSIVLRETAESKRRRA